MEKTGTLYGIMCATLALISIPKNFNIFIISNFAEQKSKLKFNLKANISCDNIDLLRELMARFNNSSFIIFERNLKCKINLLKNNALNMSITKR